MAGAPFSVVEKWASRLACAMLIVCAGLLHGLLAGEPAVGQPLAQPIPQDICSAAPGEEHHSADTQRSDHAGDIDHCVFCNNPGVAPVAGPAADWLRIAPQEPALRPDAGAQPPAVAAIAPPLPPRAPPAG